MNSYEISSAVSIQIFFVYNSSFFSLHQDQKGLPEELFAVEMYALTTELPKKVIRTRSKVQANRPGVIKWAIPAWTYIYTHNTFWHYILVLTSCNGLPLSNVFVFTCKFCSFMVLMMRIHWLHFLLWCCLLSVTMQNTILCVQIEAVERGTGYETK